MASSNHLDSGFAKLSESLLSRGYLSSKNDYPLFIKSSGSSLVVLDVYVDGILLIVDDFAELNALKALLDAQFKIKDLGSVHYFLGLEVTFNDQGYLMTQHTYTSDMLSEFHCDYFTPVTAPLDPSVKLVPDMHDPMLDPTTFNGWFANSISYSTPRLICPFYATTQLDFTNPICSPYAASPTCP